jgi:uncharacterized RDD family membrane protein YckC
MKTLNSFRMLTGLTLLLSLTLLPPPFALTAQDAQPEDPPVVAVEADEPAANAEASEPIDEGKREGRHVGPKVAVGTDVDLKTGEIAEEVVVIQGSATIEGDVEGDVVVILGKARVNGKVDGELVSVMSDVELGPQAEVDGQVVSVGGTFKKDPAARLHGPPEVVVAQFLPGYDWLDRNVFSGVLLRPLPPGLGWVWVIGLIFVGLHFLILVLLPKPVQACAETLGERPIRCFLVGVLVYILFLPLLILLSWTLIAVPILICALIAAALIGRVVVYRVAGGQVFRQIGLAHLDQPLIGWLLGTALFYLLYMVPILGWFVWFTVAPLGVGTAVATAFGMFRREGTQGQPPAALPTVVPAEQGLGVGTASATMPPPPDGLPTGFQQAPVPPVQALPLPPLTGSTPAAALSSVEWASFPRVGFWPRLGASVLDLLMIAIVNALTVSRGNFFLFLVLAYHLGMWAWKGTTLGGAVFGLKCIRLDGRPLDWSVALVRGLACFVSLAQAGLGFFWASWTRDRQSWHDIIAGTTIVKCPKPIALI